MKGSVITNDYNLNKVAEFQRVPVLNINELANAVKPVLLPGEEMVVQVIKDGKESGQGVAYLDDGTMIVVDGGRKFIGETIKVKVINADMDDEKLIFSEKEVWEEEQKNVLDSYKVGDVVEGEVSALTSFGAFIKFGKNLEGLVHISEIVWQRISHPREVLKVGDKIKAQIIDLNKSKIYLSIKRLVDDTWKQVKRAFRNPATYFHYFTSWNQVKVITNVELNNIVNDKTYFMTLDQNQSLKEDSLIKTSNDPKVYIIQNNERHLIPNEIIFEANGFKWNNILDVDYDLLDKYLETEVLE